MQSLSVFIDESRNSSCMADRPAFGVIAGVVMSRETAARLDEAIRSELGREEHASAEVKWNHFGARDLSLQSPCLSKARTILSTVFEEAARDPDIRMYVSALDGASNIDDSRDITDRSHQLMALHYRFFMHYTWGMLARDSMPLGELRYNFDSIPSYGTCHADLERSTDKVQYCLGEVARRFKHENQAPSVRLAFHDSAQSYLIQFSDLLAGAACAALDNNTGFTQARQSLLKIIAGGIADMHNDNAPDIVSKPDWPRFAAPYIDGLDTRFAIARPHLDTSVNGATNLVHYMRNRNAAPAAPV
jgi:hypothetical protein